MKEFTEQQIDDIIKLRYGQLVTTAKHTAHAPCNVIGKIFGVSGTKIIQLCQE